MPDNASLSIRHFCKCFYLSFIFQKRSEWVTVFWITFGIYLIGTVLFCLLLSGEAQHWAVDEDDDEEDDTRIRQP